MGQSEPWTVEWKKKRTKKLLLLRNSYGRVGICLHVDEPCSTCGRLKRLREEDNCYSSSGLGGGVGLDRGEGGGSNDLGGNHMVFLGGGRMGDQSSPTGVSANRVQKVDYRGNHQDTTKPKGRTDPPIPPPLLCHGDKQIRPLNQHCQRKSSIALETIKLCDKIPFLSTKYFKVGNDNLFLQ